MPRSYDSLRRFWDLLREHHLKTLIFTLLLLSSQFSFAMAEEIELNILAKAVIDAFASCVEENSEIEISLGEILDDHRMTYSFSGENKEDIINRCGVAYGLKSTTHGVLAVYSKADLTNYIPSEITLHYAAKAMINAFIDCLDYNSDTEIQIISAVTDHSVRYKHVKGDPSFIHRCGGALGFKSTDNGLLIIHSK